MPAPLNGAVCGPQVPGTKWNHTTKLEELNPCPLNACCTVWGQCGSTHDFCTDTKRANGAPGTAANNTNGCISNCVLGVVISNPPAKFLSIGYFQGDNGQRPCDNMNISNVDFTKYTHTSMPFPLHFHSLSTLFLCFHFKTIENYLVLHLFQISQMSTPKANSI